MATLATRGQQRRDPLSILGVATLRGFRRGLSRLWRALGGSGGVTKRQCNRRAG
jgi:hypothetical protein